MKLYMLWTVSLSIIKMKHTDPARKLSTNLYDIYLLLCVQWKTPDDGQRSGPKHVEFHSKNKFEKLVHLVGFIIRKLRCGWASFGSNQKSPEFKCRSLPLCQNSV